MFTHTILYVPSVPLALSFYSTVFNIPQKFITPDNSYGELTTQGVTLSFASNSLAHSNLSKGFTEITPSTLPPGFELGFTTNDIDAIIEKALKHGATLYEKKKQKPWGQTVAYVRDPNGILIEICTPME